MEKAIFGAGCFWGVEASYRELDGVIDVESGYAGGHVEDPTYKQVCTDTTGHAEVVQVSFDPEKVSYEKLVEKFWSIHNPTQVNQQGPDVGSQYRSAIFYYTDEQKLVAENSKAKAQEKFSEPIATEITAFTNYFAAEEYHQNYFAKNPHAYCPTRS